MSAKIFITLGCLLSLSASAWAQRLERDMPMPKDLAQVDVAILTVDKGHEIYTQGGHTMLRVTDKEAGTDWDFNWGTFNFDDPAFLTKFLRGVLPYSLDIVNHETVSQYYETIEKRHISQDSLQLTVEQKSRLLQALVQWSAPAHRQYAYNIWRDNCATQVRDILNDTAKGGIHTALGKLPVDATYRTNSRINLSWYPPLDALMDMLFNADVDRPLTQWENSYLPLNLRQYFNALPAFDDAGQPLPASRLFVGPRHPVIGNSSGNKGMGYILLAALLWIPGVLTLFFSYQKRRIATRRALGILLILCGLLSGAASIVMLMAWGFSEHHELYHNLNLWAMVPIDLIYAVLGLTLLPKYPRRFRSEASIKFFRVFSILHVLAWAALSVATVAGLSQQQIVPLALTFLPVYIVLYIQLPLNLGAGEAPIHNMIFTPPTKTRSPVEPNGRVKRKTNQAKRVS